ncbi:MAG: prepilin-type N-terminal cleavage/methylation domain-containing protein [Pirellulaceae bacterium]|nr:MAG: prepilin-type N-terminal cleavage/methylation domain-containing protein [Pirellulaceae bacterium]
MRGRISIFPSGFTLVELLVVIAIIGILVGVLLPAVQSAREASRAAQCKNHLRQIAFATELFHETYGAYPPARYQPRPGDPPRLDCGGEQTTWLVRIMPFLEQSAAAAGWDYSQPYANHPQEVREGTLAVYCCPSRRSAANAVGKGLLTATTTTWVTLPCGCRIPVTTTGSTIVSGAVGDYGGNHGDLSPGAFGLRTDFYFGGNGTGIIISSRARCVSNMPRDWVDRIAHRDVIDGLSNTFLAGEMHVPLGKLGQSPEDAFIYNGDHVFNCARVGGPTVPIVADIRSTGNSLVAWGSWHPGVCHFALADGSVRAIATTLDTDTLGRLCHRYDGQVVQWSN